MPNLYFATDRKTRDSLRNAYRRGDLFRIRQGIYTDYSDRNAVETTLQQQWYKVAKYLFNDAIAVFRTAAELKPVNGRVYLMVPDLQRRTVKVGRLEFMVDSGVVDKGVEPFVPEMSRSNPARQMLENLSTARAKSGIRKTLGKDWVETQLIQIVERRGEQGLNQIRDEAAELAPVLGYKKEFKVLGKMIAAILKTHPVKGVLQTRAGIAYANDEPFDRDRLKLFEVFASYLSKINLTAAPFEYKKTAWKNLTFFESYFSNYIEGTKFIIDEAEKIVATGKAAYNRHEDSHDVLSHVEISGDHTEMSRTPDSPAELIDILKVRHGILLAQRPDRNPGLFKEKPNQAGSTVFVAPEMVEGTLVQGFSIYQEISEGISRALFMHFLISEVHPFADGNGRMARIMMNAEMVSNDLYKIIVPTVCRDNYLGGLRQASRNSKFRTSVKVLHQLHQYTASINWEDYGDARKTLENDAADKEADEGLMIFNKKLSQFDGDYKAD